MVVGGTPAGRDRRPWSEGGATAVEYVVVVGLIAVVIMGGVGALGASLFAADDTEVLGHVLEGGPPCDKLPEQAKPKHC